jgi:hypothetical protein
MPEKRLQGPQHIPILTAGKWNIHSALESQAHLRVVFEKNEITLAGCSPQGSCDRRKEDGQAAPAAGIFALLNSCGEKSVKEICREEKPGSLIKSSVGSVTPASVAPS